MDNNNDNAFQYWKNLPTKKAYNYIPASGRITNEARSNFYRIAKEKGIFHSFALTSYLIDKILGSKTVTIQPTPEYIARKPTFKMIKYINYLIFKSDKLTIEYYKEVLSNFLKTKVIV